MAYLRCRLPRPFCVALASLRRTGPLAEVHSPSPRQHWLWSPGRYCFSLDSQGEAAGRGLPVPWAVRRELGVLLLEGLDRLPQKIWHAEARIGHLLRPF